MALVEPVRSFSTVREQIASWRSAGARIAIAPTMGNLHAGHLSLVDLARSKATRVVVTIFVNPTQFGPNEDIDSYPRTPREDRAALAAHGGTDLLFAPAESDIYPRGTRDITRVRLPELANDLCGRVRPGHFDGVASVVLRFLNIVRPDVLVVGEKDFQQVVLLRRMIEDLHLSVELLAGATVREADGLAMSSRNQYLTPAERKVAPKMHAAIEELAAHLRSGGKEFAACRGQAIANLEKRGFRLDYLELRDASDLNAVAPGDARGPRVLLIAAWLGHARLIDNIRV